MSGERRVGGRKAVGLMSIDLPCGEKEYGIVWLWHRARLQEPVHCKANVSGNTEDIFVFSCVNHKRSATEAVRVDINVS